MRSSSKATGPTYVLPDIKAGWPYMKTTNLVKLPGDSPSVECFFCSGQLPCREHKPTTFYDLDLQEYLMGYITGEEFTERFYGKEDPTSTS